MIKTWRLFNEDNGYSENESEYILVWSTSWVGIDGYIQLDDFDYNDYTKYKNEEFKQLDYDEYDYKVIEDSGLEWYIEDTELVCDLYGQEERVDLIEDGYCDDDSEDCENALTYEEQQEMAKDLHGLSWEIIENENHPEVIKRKEIKKFKI